MNVLLFFKERLGEIFNIGVFAKIGLLFQKIPLPAPYIAHLFQRGKLEKYVCAWNKFYNECSSLF